MKIYEFNTWGTYKSENRLFSIEEHELEEKPKSYTGKSIRVLKDDINKLQHSYGNRMYRLSDDPKPYIEAMIERKKEKLKSYEISLKEAKADLGKWEALRGKIENE